ncbi:LOW QUALITY PROTEIN: Kinesin domain-containing protein [Cephalotus follicularis]|uniref:Kinesin domain-containing protein n=1 Tax=Cephalotus follicularis TaxID=3775 RepID=A0A1Q3BX97_CEPFO|nr:LOW QUALITY PROTEIN: Kinesin domain-containing protein [Cephalotus follicularis]
MERIHVTVRARPLSGEDAKSSPWRISSNSIFIPNHSSKFDFDRIFGEDCKTAEIYQARTKEIVAAAVGGFNGTVFAYGQTNSGKTHTMRGSASEPGVIPLAVHDLFQIIQEDVDREFLLRMSYMEIYNEDINDLLVPEHRKLQIHENLERGIYVAGLREEIVASPQQILELMEFGESQRHIGETNMNVYSSRSHTIFRMVNRDKTEDEDIGSSCNAVRVSVMNLVDLAGSERAAKTGAEGVRLKEGSYINKSLMTLGTVIKKLSEGAEIQGGHVPYRDSKLTRILQPALGGNANTAMICNITLAQIHADETKSSLQFASRALRVTNCAHVNEILTDTALLKRQKKEIEELRAKLLGSHSEHLEEEILNLRNTLLQSELERERIALELEEEKKAQAEREKVLQEQAKKIKNLSSMVLYSNKDEKRNHLKKEKRRGTWCLGNLLKETVREVNSNLQSKDCPVKSTRPKRGVGPLLPFEELDENEVWDDFCKQDEDCESIAQEDCTLPDPCALLHVTNRRKVPLRKENSIVGDNELANLQADYEDLLLKFKNQRSRSEIQINSLERKLVEGDLFHNECNEYFTHVNKSTKNGDNHVSLRESEAILVIKQLQQKIKMLEVEKSSSWQSLDCLVEIATEQNICAREKFEELHEELCNAREEARVACEQLASSESMGTIDVCVLFIVNANFDFMMKLSIDVQQILYDVQNSKEVFESASSLVDGVFHSFSAIFNEFLEFKSMICQFSQQQKLIIIDYEKLHCYMRQKAFEVENEKLLLYNQSVELQKQIQQLRLDAQNYEASLAAFSKQQDAEKSKFLSHIQTLEREISCLSSCSLAKEKDNLRKDLEKTKTKLKETDFKLKNAIQEKTKLEGEKAFAEREAKRLHGQRTLLDRDISKCDSLAGRRRDSVVEKSSKVFDPKKHKGLSVSFEQTMPEDYKKLEVLAFEMETTIASLEDELASAYREKEEAISRNEGLASKLEGLSEKLNISNSERYSLQEEFSSLILKLEESSSSQEKMDSSMKTLLQDKEELAMQLTDSLLEMEEEKAIWLAKEKASIETIKEKAKLYNAEIMSLSKDMLEVRDELMSCKEECKILMEQLTCCEEGAKWLKNCSMEQSMETEQLKNDLQKPNVESRSHKVSYIASYSCTSFIAVKRPFFSSQNLGNQLLIMTKKRGKLITNIEEQQSHVVEVELFKKHYNNVILGANTQMEELTERISCMEVKVHNDEVKYGKQIAKLRMRLRGTQAQLDAFRYRYNQAVAESDMMNRKYEEASMSLKDRLASKGIEVLNLKKQLAVALEH